MTREVMKQDRGPTLIFEGELLAESEISTRQGKMLMQVWETQGGAYIAYSELRYEDTDRLDRRAEVIEPILRDEPENMGETLGKALTGDKNPARDLGAMQRAVMDFYSWDYNAIAMVRKQTDFDLRWEVA